MYQNRFIFSNRREYLSPSGQLTFRVTFSNPVPVSEIAISLTLSPYPLNTNSRGYTIRINNAAPNNTLVPIPSSSSYMSYNTMTGVATYNGNLFIGLQGTGSTMVSSFEVTSTGMAGDTTALEFFGKKICDADGDGSPNHLDLDSDADGCYDALEGDENVTSAQLNPDGSINTISTGGVGSSASSLTMGVPNLVNPGGAADMGSDAGQGIGDSQNASVSSGCLLPSCYKPAATVGTVLDIKHGITALGRAGVNSGNWPMVRKGAWTALEAKTKGFVVNRIPTTAQVIAIANPVEGMMVYDEEADCLKIYTTTDNGATFSWQCFNTQTCPD